MKRSHLLLIPALIYHAVAFGLSILNWIALLVLAIIAPIVSWPSEVITLLWVLVFVCALPVLLLWHIFVVTLSFFKELSNIENDGDTVEVELEQASDEYFRGLPVKFQ